MDERSRPPPLWALVEQLQPELQQAIAELLCAAGRSSLRLACSSARALVNSRVAGIELGIELGSCRRGDRPPSRPAREAVCGCWQWQQGHHSSWAAAAVRGWMAAGGMHLALLAVGDCLGVLRSRPLSR
jgi:hypothetical protein